METTPKTTLVRGQSSCGAYHSYHWRFGRAVSDRRTLGALGVRHGAAKEGTIQSECKELVLVDVV